jgi:hypothetical protein
MHSIIYTLQDFMVHTKNVTYVLMGVALIAFVVFWGYLTDRDTDNSDEQHHH